MRLFRQQFAHKNRRARWARLRAVDDAEASDDDDDGDDDR